MSEPPFEVEASHDRVTLSWVALDADSFVGADGGTEKHRDYTKHINMTITWGNWNKVYIFFHDGMTQVTIHKHQLLLYVTA